MSLLSLIPRALILTVLLGLLEAGEEAGGQQAEEAGGQQADMQRRLDALKARSAARAAGRGPSLPPLTRPNTP